MGQLPFVRITPDAVFEHVGLDYAGPMYLKLGSVRKPTIVKSYVSLFPCRLRQFTWNLSPIYLPSAFLLV